jgi:hypothetical protein
MEVHGNINMMGNKLVQAGFAMETNFPSNPTPGAVCFKDAVLYFCAAIAGNLPVWVPLTKTLEMIRFDIAVPALEWTLVHNLNTNAPFVQVYDHNGLWIIPDYINISVDGRVTEDSLPLPQVWLFCNVVLLKDWLLKYLHTLKTS